MDLTPSSQHVAPHATGLHHRASPGRPRSANAADCQHQDAAHATRALAHSLAPDDRNTAPSVIYSYRLTGRDSVLDTADDFKSAVMLDVLESNVVRVYGTVEVDPADIVKHQSVPVHQRLRPPPIPPRPSSLTPAATAKTLPDDSDRSLELSFECLTVAMKRRNESPPWPEQLEAKSQQVVNKLKSLVGRQPTTPVTAAVPATKSQLVNEEIEMKSLNGDDETPTIHRTAMLPSPIHYNATASASPLPAPVTVTESAECRTVLQSVSGVARPGELLAIMGASGAGKTSLLNVLAGRLRNNGPNQRITGTISVNDQPITASQLSCLSAYVLQDDALTAVMTAREHIEFSARMRLPLTVTEADIDRRVQSILDELGLTHCADVPVGLRAAGDGDSGNVDTGSSHSSLFDPQSFVGQLLSWLTVSHRRGLSGGEQRRVSIGIELVNDPKLLFLDECTSGLDSTTALTIIRSLKALASRGRTIVCTIHSPSQRIYEQFDSLLLLTQTGEVAYHGPANTALRHFQSLGYECPDRMNTGDYLMKLLTVSDDRDRVRVNEIVACHAHIRTSTDTKTVSDKHSSSSRSVLVKPWKSSTNQPYLHQFSLLTHRAYLQFTRQPINILARVAENLFLTMFIGLLFLDTGFDQRSIYARIAFIFFLVCCGSLITLVSSVLTFTEERSQFTRERREHWYRVSAYFHSKSCIEVPVQIFLSCCLGLVGYFMVGLQADARHVLEFSLGLSLLALASNSLGLILGCLAPTPLIAVMLSPLCIIPFMVTSGFFINLDDLPVYLWPLRALSPHLYVFTSLFANEFNDLAFHCRDSEAINVWVKSELFHYCPLGDGRRVLEIFHIPSESNYTLNMVYTACLAVGFRIIAWAALTLVDRRQSREEQAHPQSQHAVSPLRGTWHRLRNKLGLRLQRVRGQ